MSRLITTALTPDLRANNINSQLIVTPKNVAGFLADYYGSAVVAGRVDPTGPAPEGYEEWYALANSGKTMLRYDQWLAQKKAGTSGLQTAGFNFDFLTKPFKTHPKTAYTISAAILAAFAYQQLKKKKGKKK